MIKLELKNKIKISKSFFKKINTNSINKNFK